jgi:hypothetical protein
MEHEAANVVRRMRDAFEEVPGLCVNVDEAALFWRLDREVCDRALAALCAAGVLTLGIDRRYRRRSARRVPGAYAEISAACRIAGARGSAPGFLTPRVGSAIEHHSEAIHCGAVV